MSSFGYARVSTVDQDLTIQVDALEAAGCETIRSERLSGSSTKRPELNTLLEFIRQGDEFVVTRLDRFARSSRDLQNFVHDFREKGVTLRVLEKNSTPVLQQESVFSICWRHLPSLRLVSVRNVKPKALLRPKPRASTEVASHLLMRRGYTLSKLMAWERPQLQRSWALVGCRFTEHLRPLEAQRPRRSVSSWTSTTEANLQRDPVERRQLQYPLSVTSGRSNCVLRTSALVR